ATLGFASKLIHVLTGDASILGNALCCFKLVGHVIGEISGHEIAGTIHHIHAVANTAHGFHATGDADIEGLVINEGRYHVAGLLGGATLRIHGGATGSPIFAHAEPGDAGQVARLFARLGNATANHLIYQVVG